MKEHGGGFGDVRMTLAKGEKIAWLMLWPHTRPWHFKHPEPMLRGLPQVAHLAAILGQALAAAASRPAGRAATAAEIPAHITPPQQVSGPGRKLRTDPARETPSSEPVARLA